MCSFSRGYRSAIFASAAICPPASSPIGKPARSQAAQNQSSEPSVHQAFCRGWLNVNRNPSIPGRSRQCATMRSRSGLSRSKCPRMQNLAGCRRTASTASTLTGSPSELGGWITAQSTPAEAISASASSTEYVGIWRWCALLLPFCQRWICESAISMRLSLSALELTPRRRSPGAVDLRRSRWSNWAPTHRGLYVAFATKLRAREARRHHRVARSSARVALEPRDAGTRQARPGRPGVLSVRGRLLLRVSLRHVLQPGLRIALLVSRFGVVVRAAADGTRPVADLPPRRVADSAVLGSRPRHTALVLAGHVRDRLGPRRLDGARAPPGHAQCCSLRKRSRVRRVLLVGGAADPGGVGLRRGIRAPGTRPRVLVGLGTVVPG